MPSAKFLTAQDLHPPRLSNRSSNSTDSPAQEKGPLTPATDTRNSALNLIPSTTWAGHHGVLSYILHVSHPPWALPTTSPGYLHTGSPSQWSPATGCSPHSSCSYLFKTFFVVHDSPPKQCSQEAAYRAEQGRFVQRVRELQWPRPESQSEQDEGEPTQGEGKGSGTKYGIRAQAGWQSVPTVQ